MNRWSRLKYLPPLPLGKDGQRVTAGKEHLEIALRAAEEGMVLLKNNLTKAQKPALPLEHGTRVALLGKGTFDYVRGGGGSGEVTVDHEVNLYEGLEAIRGAVEIEPETAAFYRDYVAEQKKAGKQAGRMEEPALSDALMKKAAAFADTAIISISRFSGEGWDRGDEDFCLTAAEKKLVQKAKKHFSRIIAVLNVGGMVDTSWFAKEDKIQGALLAWQGGIQGGLAAARILMGEVNPSGKLTDTLAAKLADYPSTPGFHDSDLYVNYTEDIYVGYRYFETVPKADKAVVYPFGYGLSYTDFLLSAPIIFETDGELTVSLDVTNIGARAGKEVVQVYFEAPQGKLGKPRKQLIAFKKTGLLQPGQTQKILIDFQTADMASYDDLGKVQKSAYVLEQGEYRFHIGTSVRDTEEAAFVWTCEKDIVVKQLEEKLTPTCLKERMLADGSMEKLPSYTGKAKPVKTLKGLPKLDVKNASYASDTREHKGRLLWGGNYTEKTLQDVAEGTATMEEFLAQLSLEDLAHLLGGQPNAGYANTFGIGNLEDYGVPNVMTADGPAGLRIQPECGVCTTAFPCSTMVACTWNPDLAEAIGRAGGEEVKENNFGVWLTPAINIHRSPLCGRNFEYYSEDPIVAGKMAAAMVRGIQSNHIAASVKHFALNNKEVDRMESDSRASERAIREIYLKAFEIVVKEADPWTIMTSYNIINGVRSSENTELVTDILRGEWGYQGMVTTDWWNHAEHYKEVQAGNDLRMPHGYPDRLIYACEKGEITREQLELCARRILEMILKLD